MAFVDVVGFSRLMAADETGTFERWLALRDGTIVPALGANGGTLVKSTGDGVLATFAHSAAAVRWARAVQVAAKSEPEGFALRIALNYCHVLYDGGDVVGDGVNVAAELQQRAAPGGILMTEAMRDALQHEPGFDTQSLGLVTLKHDRGCVQAFVLADDDSAMGSAVPSERGLPVVAVLPFRSLGGDDDGFFAEGLVEDVVQSLAGLSDLVVIARATTQAFAGRSVDPRDVGRILAAGYVLSGTVRRASGRIRVGFELNDARTGLCLATDRVEVPEDDLFAVQDSIIEVVISRIAPQVSASERRRCLRKTPASFSAYELYLRGLDLIGSLDRAAFEEGMAFLERAMAADPTFAAPVAWAARAWNIRLGQGWSADADADIRMAATLAERAIGLDPQNALALATYGHVQSYLLADYDTAEAYLERARVACPSSPEAWLLSSATQSYLGRGAEAVAFGERALRLSPLDRRLFFYHHLLGLAHFVAGDYGLCLRWCRRANAENGRYTSNVKLMAAAAMATGQTEAAHAFAARAIELDPGFRLARYRGTGRPFRDLEASHALADLLSAAGLPE